MKYIPPVDSEYYIKLPYSRYNRATAFTRIQAQDGWDDVVYLTEGMLDPSGSVRPMEYIYVLVNKSVPNMVKIGMTTKTPDERAAQISAATGVPTPWLVVFQFGCYRSDLLEEEIHEYLSEYRVNTHREMFAISSYAAQEIIERLGSNYIFIRK